MPSAPQGSSDYSLSPSERKQKHEIGVAIGYLKEAIQELQTRVEASEPSLKTRDILQNSTRALATLKAYVEKKSMQ